MSGGKGVIVAGGGGTGCGLGGSGRHATTIIATKHTMKTSVICFGIVHPKVFICKPQESIPQKQTFPTVGEALFYLSGAIARYGLHLSKSNLSINTEEKVLQCIGKN
jgi:hypothetical protein